MRRLGSAVLAFGLAASAAAQDAGSWQRELQLNTGYEYAQARGAGRSSSFLTRGSQINQTVFSNSTRRVEGGLDRLVLAVRGSSDRRIDPDHTSLQQFYYLRQRRDNELRVGDVMASLSPYTLNRGLKGAAFTTEQLGDTKISLAGGIDKPLWAEVWDKRAGETKNIYVGGAGVEKTLGGALTTSLNLTDTHERGIATGVANANNQVGSLGLDFHPASAFSLAAEGAYGRYDPGAGASRQNGSAVKTDLRLKGDRLRMDIGFERVTPEFATLSGSATPDKEKWSGRLRWQAPAATNLSLSHDYYFNGLSGSAAASRTYNNITTVGADRKGIAGRSTLGLECRFTHRLRHNPAGDQRGLSGLLGASDRVGAASLRGSYELRTVNDSSSAGQDTLQHIVTGGAATRAKSGDITFRPDVRLSLTQDTNRTTDKTNLTLDGSGRLTVEFGRRVEASAGYNLNAVDRESAGDQERHVLDASLRWRVAEDTRLSAVYRMNRNQFAGTSRDYVEETLSVGLDQKF